MSTRALAVAALAALACGCGYVGDPLPPSLHIPVAVADLRVVEYGSRLVVEFTAPAVTTDGLPLEELAGAELRLGQGGAPFDRNQWEAGAKAVQIRADKPGPVRYEYPAGDFVGREIVIGVRLANERGRKSAWSNLVSIGVLPPVSKPEAVKATPQADGVRLTWTGSGASYRIFRKMPDEKAPALIARSDTPEYLDRAAQFDKTYEYVVQAVRDKAESEVTAPVTVTPKDVFPPAVPSGLTAISGVGGIELAWERNTEADFKSYRLYRAIEGGPFERIADELEIPTFSDHAVQSGKKYRYAVASIDQAGNESGKSAAVEAVAP